MRGRDTELVSEGKRGSFLTAEKRREEKLGVGDSEGI